MNTEIANYYLDHLDESLDTYLEKTRCAFSGQNVEIQFFLQDAHLSGQYLFSWKQQNILTRGEITVYPVSKMLTISDTLKQISEQYQRCQEQILTLEKENECLNKTNAKLITDIEDMISMKNAMEKDLYRKFLLLLNTKKKKIRELQEALDKKQTPDKLVYNKTTDESSEESDKESGKKVQESNIESTNVRKRKMNNKSEQKVTSKVSKRDFKRCTNFSPSDSPSPEPSTSKGKLVLQDIKYMTKAKDFDISEESEEDLFS